MKTRHLILKAVKANTGSFRFHLRIPLRWNYTNKVVPYFATDYIYRNFSLLNEIRGDKDTVNEEIGEG